MPSSPQAARPALIMSCSETQHLKSNLLHFVSGDSFMSNATELPVNLEMKPWSRHASSASTTGFGVTRSTNGACMHQD